MNWNVALNDRLTNLTTMKCEKNNNRTTPLTICSGQIRAEDFLCLIIGIPFPPNRSSQLMEKQGSHILILLAMRSTFKKSI